MENAFEALLSCLDEQRDDEELKISALEATRAVVYRHVHARERCIAAGVLKCAVGVIDGPSSGVTESACKLLWNLCVNEEPDSTVQKSVLDDGLETVLDAAEERHAENTEVWQCVNDLRRLFGLKCESPLVTPEPSP